MYFTWLLNKRNGVYQADGRGNRPSAGEVGFASGRLHSLRHFFCSLCANEGVPERVLMTWLGHASSAMVKTYYHLNNEEAQLQMSKLGRHGVLGVT
jgi:integrase